MRAVGFGWVFMVLPGLIVGCSKLDDEKEDDDSFEVLLDSLEEEFKGMQVDGEFTYPEEEWVIHDPSRIVAIDGYLMIGVTGKAQEDNYDCGIETWYIPPGDDEWRPGQCLLQEKPAWVSDEVPTSDGAYWAPGMLDGRAMYYTVPPGDAMADGEETASCLGLITATGKPPNLVWTDHGAPISCTAKGEDNEELPEPGSIDAAVFVDDDGIQHLVYGGGHIWSTQLDASTGTQINNASWASDDPTYVHLANGPNVDEDGVETGEEQWVEAAFLAKRNGYYYLYLNWYRCCNGPESTYEIRVGRSTSATGPFVDADGVSMLDGGGKLLLDRSSGFNGPGHPGLFEYEGAEGPVEVFSFHHYPDDGEPWATIETRLLDWTDDNWPVVTEQAFEPMDYWESIDSSNGR